MNSKSLTCKSRRTGRPLTEYRTEEEAAIAAARLDHMMHYRCRGCGYWHLSPTRNHTPCRDYPECTGGQGRPKKSYETRRGAEQRAEIIRQEHHVALDVYPCPHGYGWHLTKRRF